MKTCLSTLKHPALAGAALALPFLALELAFNTTGFSPKYALDTAVLFGVLWLLPAAFTLILLPPAHSALAGYNLLEQPAGLIFKVAQLVIIAVLWASLLADQMPCFLGIPNCD